MEPKIREDLILSEQEKDGTTHLVVKDPSTSKFFRFGGIEFFIIRHLDGGHSPEEVREKFQTEYDAPLPAETLHAFLGQLQTLGLLEGEAPIDRGRRQSPLYLRFKLIDPDRLLAWLLPRVRFFFTRPFLVLSAGLILVSVLLTAANQEEIALDLPRLFRFSSTFLIFLTVLVLASTHEFAHGLACKRYGGEVHEMGFMLLFFFPALSCNVSDTWLFPEKRKRMAVVFAGAYFELVLWAAGTVIWRLTPPDTIPHYVALLVMATLGLKTFFNLNPLLKLDGYYLLSDFLEIPNLRKKAGAYVKVDRPWVIGHSGEGIRPHAASAT